MLQDLTTLTTTHPHLTLFTLLLLLPLLYTLYRTHLDTLSSIPGPLLPRLTPLWLYTHTYLGTESRALHALHLLYGPIVRIAPHEISISDPSALHQIYTAKGGFLKAACYKNFDIDGHASIFSALDPKQRAPRAKAVVGLFAMGAIRENALGTVEECAGEFVEGLREARSRGEKVDVLQLARSLALDAVTGYLFGRRYGGLEERRKQRNAVKDAGLSAGGFVDTFVAVGRFFLLPNGLFLLLDKLSAMLFPDAATDASMAAVDAYVADVVRSASGTLEDPGAEDTYQRRLLLAGFSESETKAQCKDLIFAGTDSTGMNLATACWYLAKDQELLRTLHHELTSTSTPPSVPLNPTIHPHLSSLLLETLRISMANPTRLPRVVPPGGADLLGYRVPAGTNVGCSAYSLHFDAGSFEGPFGFRPGRWVGGDDVDVDVDADMDADVDADADVEEKDAVGEGEKAVNSDVKKSPNDDDDNDDDEQPHPRTANAARTQTSKTQKMHASLFPFGHGPRQCIARNLATTELEVALRRVVESGCLVGARAEGGRVEGEAGGGGGRVEKERAGEGGKERMGMEIEIREWFNSSVVGGGVWIS